MKIFEYFGILVNQMCVMKKYATANLFQQIEKTKKEKHRGQCYCTSKGWILFCIFAKVGMDLPPPIIVLFLMFDIDLYYYHQME